MQGSQSYWQSAVTHRGRVHEERRILPYVDAMEKNNKSTVSVQSLKCLLLFYFLGEKEGWERLGISNSLTWTMRWC